MTGRVMRGGRVEGRAIAACTGLRGEGDRPPLLLKLKRGQMRYCAAGTTTRRREHHRRLSVGSRLTGGASPRRWCWRYDGTHSKCE